MADTMPVSLAAMFLIGLLGSGHCAGMCGGITTGLGFAAGGGEGVVPVLGYNLGRIASYATAGALVATLGYWGSEYLSLGPILRTFAGAILVLMGLYLAGWWRVLVYLEKAGARLWRYIQPLGRRFMPVTSPWQAIALGMVWGWLPCGLVYTALAYAAVSARAGEGALAMAAFGLGTAPMMVVGGLFSRSVVRVTRDGRVRRTMALLMMGFGLWTIGSSVGHLAPGENPPHSMHQHVNPGEG